MIVPRSIEPFGDAAVLVELEGADTVSLAAAAHALAARLRSALDPRAGWGAVVPAAASVLVHHDPARVVSEPAVELVRAQVTAAGEPSGEWPPGVPVHDIPVRYGAEAGPDLESVAVAAGLSPEAVIELHRSTTYRVLFLGFAPGFAYLGPVPTPLVVPRRPSTRVRVPAGSVAVAGGYTAIYPIDSPGGWHLIGRTDATVWDPARDAPALLSAGDLVRFVPDAS